MSALGHKQTCALQKVMSALPQKQTCALQIGMSAFTPKADISVGHSRQKKKDYGGVVLSGPPGNCRTSKDGWSQL